MHCFKNKGGSVDVCRRQEQKRSECSDSIDRPDDKDRFRSTNDKFQSETSSADEWYSEHNDERAQPRSSRYAMQISPRSNDGWKKPKACTSTSTDHWSARLEKESHELNDWICTIAGVLAKPQQNEEIRRFENRARHDSRLKIKALPEWPTLGHNQYHIRLHWDDPLQAVPTQSNFHKTNQ